MMPEDCVDFLLGWVSGDESQMPPMATGPDKRVDGKEIRVEACRLLALVRPTCSRFETVQDALLQCMHHCTEKITEVDVAVAALEALGSNFDAGGVAAAHNPELTAAVVALLKMNVRDFAGNETGEVQDRIMVAQTAALTALSKLRPPAELAEHLNSFLLNSKTPADLLWEPAASALQACKTAHPGDAFTLAGVEKSRQALEWILKSKAGSRSMDDRGLMNRAAAAMVTLEMQSDELARFLVSSKQSLPSLVAPGPVLRDGLRFQVATIGTSSHSTAAIAHSFALRDPAVLLRLL